MNYNYDECGLKFISMDEIFTYASDQKSISDFVLDNFEYVLDKTIEAQSIINLPESVRPVGTKIRTIPLSLVEETIVLKNLEDALDRTKSTLTFGSSADEIEELVHNKKESLEELAFKMGVTEKQTLHHKPSVAIVSNEHNNDRIVKILIPQKLTVKAFNPIIYKCSYCGDTEVVQATSPYPVNMFYNKDCDGNIIHMCNDCASESDSHVGDTLKTNDNFKIW